MRCIQEIQLAIGGTFAAREVRATEEGGLMLSVADSGASAYKKILRRTDAFGTNRTEIDEAVKDVRLEILGIFAVVLAITILLSLYLAGTITRPVQRLAAAAELVRQTRDRSVEIPDLGRRSDEIGDLARSVRDMTSELWRRMDAIGRFAADVAHEIKNPLTSLRSAVETAARLNDPERQKRLMAVIVDDVERLGAG